MLCLHTGGIAFADAKVRGDAGPFGEGGFDLLDDLAWLANVLLGGKFEQIFFADIASFTEYAGGSKARCQRVAGECDIEGWRYRPISLVVHQKGVIPTMIVIVGCHHMKYSTTKYFLGGLLVLRQTASYRDEIAVFQSIA